MVLADSGFCSVEFLEGVRRELGHHAVVGVRRDRRLTDGRRLDQSNSRGERVWLEGLEVAVYVAAYWLKKRDGSREKSFVLCTKALSPAYIVRWGKKRWSIEKASSRLPREDSVWIALLRERSSESIATCC